DEVDERVLEGFVERAQDTLRPLADSLKGFREWLRLNYIPANKVRGGRGFVLYNAVGMPLPLWKHKTPYMLEACAAAHILQGLEQACIQEQIVRDTNCHVISIEHDGFIVNQGEPDMGLWADITAKHGLPSLKLEEKPL